MTLMTLPSSVSPGPEEVGRKRQLWDFTVGETVAGKVIKVIKSGVVVNVGAEKLAILDAGEVRDGFPVEGMPPKDSLVKARVLDLQGGELRLTMRSGDLARPPRERISPGDYKVAPFA